MPPTFRKAKETMWVFPKIVVPQNGWFKMENPIKMDDLEGKPTIFGNTHVLYQSLVKTQASGLRKQTVASLGAIRHSQAFSLVLLSRGPCRENMNELD